MTDVPGYAFDLAAPTVFVQWKGTDVCATLHCICGEDGHVDAAFAYNVRCETCGRLYEMPYSLPVRLNEDQGDTTEASALPGDGGDHAQLYLDNAAKVIETLRELAVAGNVRARAMLDGHAG